MQQNKYIKNNIELCLILGLQIASIYFLGSNLNAVEGAYQMIALILLTLSCLLVVDQIVVNMEINDNDNKPRSA